MPSSAIIPLDGRRKRRKIVRKRPRPSTMAPRPRDHGGQVGLGRRAALLRPGGGCGTLPGSHSHATGSHRAGQARPPPGGLRSPCCAGSLRDSLCRPALPADPAKAGEGQLPRLTHPFRTGSIQQPSQQARQGSPSWGSLFQKIFRPEPELGLAACCILRNSLHIPGRRPWSECQRILPSSAPPFGEVAPCRPRESGKPAGPGNARPPPSVSPWGDGLPPGCRPVLQVGGRKTALRASRVAPAPCGTKAEGRGRFPAVIRRTPGLSSIAVTHPFSDARQDSAERKDRCRSNPLRMVPEPLSTESDRKRSPETRVRAPMRLPCGLSRFAPSPSPAP